MACTAYPALPLTSTGDSEYIFINDGIGSGDDRITRSDKCIMFDDVVIRADRIKVNLIIGACVGWGRLKMIVRHFNGHHVVYA